MNLKNNTLIYIGLSLIIVLDSCSGNPRDCNNTIFKEARRDTNDSISFFNDTLDKNITIGNVCFKKFHLYTNHDSLSEYWAIRNDTVMVMRDEHKLFKNPKIIPFLPTKLETEKIYRYHDYEQFAEDIYIRGSWIEVEVLDKKNIDNDTIYYLRHTAILPVVIDIVEPSDITIPYNNRYFIVSMKRGIIGYSTKKIGNVSKLKFLW